MSKRAIVTGGAGFVGSHLVDVLLDHEWSVLVVDDLSSGKMENVSEARRRGATVHITDIRADDLHDVFTRHEPEVVFHLAAQSKVRPSVHDPMYDASVNLLGTLNVLDAARVAGARKVSFASSGGAVYGEGVKLPAKESYSKKPASPYGISKMIVEDYFRWYREFHGLEYTLLAPANIYGPRQDAALEGGVVAIFINSMLQGERPTIFGDGKQTRDFIYVGDICDAFLRSVDSGSGEFLNVGSGVETSVLDLYDAIADLVGFDRKPAFDDVKPGDVLRSVLDPSRARKALGWEPFTLLRDGLARTVEWDKKVRGARG